MPSRHAARQNLSPILGERGADGARACRCRCGVTGRLRPPVAEGPASLVLPPSPPPSRPSARGSPAGRFRARCVWRWSPGRARSRAGGRGAAWASPGRRGAPRAGRAAASRLRPPPPPLGRQEATRRARSRAAAGRRAASRRREEGCGPGGRGGAPRPAARRRKPPEDVR